MLPAEKSNSVMVTDGPLGAARVAVVGTEPQLATLLPVLQALAADQPALALSIVPVEPGNGAGPARPALDALSEATLAVIALDGTEGLSEAVRHRALLAYRLTGLAPILAVAGRRAADAGAYGEVLAEWNRFASDLGIAPDERIAIDAAARVGATAGGLAEAVARLITARRSRLEADGAMRLWVTSSPGAPTGTTRTIEGLLVRGHIAVGQAVVALPSATSGKVTAVTACPSQDGDAGNRVRVEVDQPLDITDGTAVTGAEGRPEQADQVVAHLVWLGRKPMLPGRTYNARLGNQTTTAQISSLKHRINPANLDTMAARRLDPASVGSCNISFAQPVVFDAEDTAHAVLRPTSRFVLEDRVDGGIVGIGTIAFTLRRATNIHWQALAVDKTARATLKSQRPGCLWFTGLSGSGKSTIASLLEKRLAAMGRHTYTLDGDNVRHGLNRDLGFTDADRVENIRRVGEVSKLLVDAGLIVLVSFISPFRAERRMARSLFPAGEFIEVFVDTPLEICEQRDVKGLYKKARAGQLKNFTGIDSPYEAPEEAEVRLLGGATEPEVMVERMIADLTRRGMI